MTANKNSYIYNFRKIFKTWLTVVYADWWYSISFRWKMMSVMNISRFFFIMARSSPSHSYKRPNQSLASIHWLTYKPAVVVAVVLFRLWWVCVWCIVGAANMCGRQHVAACLCQHAWNGVYIETWSAARSRLTLAYSLPTACPNKALNRLERLQSPKGVLKWKKNLTQLVL